ncbi:hypothetical protein F4803DRAFT_576113 [Xylaria telfairii]|nr:hypothetical protein F4803DRAFT_576113 [Xylaria telfairii]
MVSLNQCSDVSPSNTKHLNRGGLKYLERFLGLRLDNVVSTDAVFISLDLEVASDRQKLHISTDKPLITQVGFASLDTRDLASLSVSHNLNSLISVQMYQAEVPPQSRKATRKRRRPCIFAQTQYISQEEVPTVITENLRIQDDSEPDTPSGQLRAIVLVGHSIREDLKVLHLLGIDISSIAPILAIIDTHTISRFILPPHHPNLPKLPEQTFSLMGVLAQLNCWPHPATFHNAGNDAVYSLYAMLMLAVRNGNARRAELSARELVNLDTIARAVSQIQSDRSPEN